MEVAFKPGMNHFKVTLVVLLFFFGSQQAGAERADLFFGQPVKSQYDPFGPSTAEFWRQRSLQGRGTKESLPAKTARIAGRRVGLGALFVGIGLMMGIDSLFSEDDSDDEVRISDADREAQDQQNEDPSGARATQEFAKVSQ